MSQRNISILSTRRLDEDLAKTALDKGIIIDVVPFIRTEPVTGPSAAVIGQLTTQELQVIFTSVNAVHAVGAQLISLLPPWQVHGLSGATMTAIQEHWPQLRPGITAPDALSLAQALIEKGTGKEYVFFCGDRHREELPALLEQAGIRLRKEIVYRTLLTPHKLQKDYDGILFFSPSAVESYLRSNEPGSSTIFFAIGNTTAALLETKTANPVVTASRPDAEQLVQEAFNYFRSAGTRADKKI